MTQNELGLQALEDKDLIVVALFVVVTHQNLSIGQYNKTERVRQIF